MTHSIRYLILTAATVLSGTGAAAQIQQVAFQNCSPDSCTEGCVTIADCGPGDYCVPGRSDRCTLKDRRHDLYLDWCGRCGPIGRPARKGCPVAQKIHWCCTTKGSCDSGWAPPARLPVNRTGGWYQSYWPNAWYGNPGGNFSGGAPIVYQPTDTTQLGYSYNRVPTWRPSPGMIPRVPTPSAYHARMCPRQHASCPGVARYNAAPNIGTPIMYDGGSNCPSCGPGYVSTAAPRGTSRSAQTTLRPPAIQPLPSPPEAPTIVAAQPIMVPDFYTSSDAADVVNPTPPATDHSVRPVSSTTGEQPGSTGARRPGKRVNQAAARTRRPASRNSGGWFGLPSLNEIRF